MINTAGATNTKKLQLSGVIRRRIRRPKKRSRWSECDYSRVTGFGYSGPSKKVFHWTASLLSDSLNGISHREATLPLWCLHRVGTVKSFLNIEISRCHHTKASCTRTISYSHKTNNCYRRHGYCESLVRDAEQSTFYATSPSGLSDSRITV
jgi:hypothetical protein